MENETESFDDDADSNSDGDESARTESSSEQSFEILECKNLTKSEASKCLHTLGKCASGLGFAYLGLNASKRGLTDVSVILKFKHVIFLDLSDNQLTNDAIQVLSSLKYLLVLLLDANKLTSAQLEPLPYLQVLTLKKNRLSTSADIRHGLLERLELTNNGLREVQLDFDTLHNLRSLELRGNLLRSTAGLCSRSIVELYLADNSIEKLQDLENLSSLKLLHIRANEISTLDGFSSQCASLSYLNLRANKIGKISELRKLACLPALETLIILENPAFAERQIDQQQLAYRPYVLTILPRLKRIDKDPVIFQEKEEADELRNGMLENDADFSQFDAQSDSDSHSHSDSDSDD